MNPLLNSKIRIRSLYSNNGNNMNDLPQTFLKYKKNLARGIAIFLLTFIIYGNIYGSQGALGITNKIDSPYTSASYAIGHWQDGSEGLGNHDHTYGAMFNPSGIAAKIVSIIEGAELDNDVRPLNSLSSVTLELSLVSQNGQPITISSYNELRLRFPLGEGCEFGSEIITLYDPDGTAHDVRKVIAENGGVISLADLNGTYESEVPYASITITFETAPPEVDTLPATDIRDKSAKLKGKIIYDVGGDCEYRFSYWKEGGSITTTEWRGSVNAGEEFSQYVYGLDSLSTYYFRAEARNSAGSTEGDVESFVISLEPPEVDTLSAIDIGENSATLKGKIIEDGGEECGYRFSYWKEGGTTTTTGWSYYVETYEEFSEYIDDLVPGSTYYFRAEAKNSAGESSGDLESFITGDSGTIIPPPQPPEEPQDLQEGILDIFYKIASLEEGRDTAKFEIVHKSGASEDLDENDMLYENKDSYTHPKIVSIIGSVRRYHELQKDSRPEESLTRVYLNIGIEPAESFIISKQELILKMPLLNKNFGDKPIVIQQYDISDPNGYPAYDVRKLIEEGKGEGIIKLQDLQDADKSHGQYFELSFNRSVADINLDGIVDSNDYFFIEKNWQKQGNSKADIGSHKGTGLPDGRVDYWDVIAMSEEWTGETIDPNIVNLIDYRTESFETGNFNKFNWKHSGDFNWIITPENSYSGFYSAKSGLINDDETSSLEVSVDCQPGFIAFYRKVSSENNFDKLKFYIDDVLKDESSGESDWKRAYFPVEEGRRKFTWNYDKDGSVSKGDDAVYIDGIVFPVE